MMHSIASQLLCLDIIQTSISRKNFIGHFFEIIKNSSKKKKINKWTGVKKKYWIAFMYLKSYNFAVMEVEYFTGLKI